MANLEHELGPMRKIVRVYREGHPKFVVLECGHRVATSAKVRAHCHHCRSGKKRIGQHGPRPQKPRVKRYKPIPLPMVDLRTLGELKDAIVAAAIRCRDWDWDEDAGEGSALLEELDAAVDAYRARLAEDVASVERSN